MKKSNLIHLEIHNQSAVVCRIASYKMKRPITTNSVYLYSAFLELLTHEYTEGYVYTNT